MSKEKLLGISVALVGKTDEGKTTAANLAQEEFGGIVKSFASPLKEIQDFAQNRCGFPAVQDRKFQQWIETEWALQKDRNVLVNLMARDLQHTHKSYPNSNTFVDDVSFLNEASLLRDGHIVSTTSTGHVETISTGRQFYMIRVSRQNVKPLSVRFWIVDAVWLFMVMGVTIREFGKGGWAPAMMYVLVELPLAVIRSFQIMRFVLDKKRDFVTTLSIVLLITISIIWDRFYLDEDLDGAVVSNVIVVPIMALVASIFFRWLEGGVHASNSILEKIPVDKTIINDGTLNELRAKVIEACHEAAAHQNKQKQY